jgi:hypothetical protein
VALGPGDAVTFSMWPASGDLVVDDGAASTIDAGVAGTSPAVVEYALQAADVDEAVTLYAQFKVAWAGGGTTKFPRPKPMTVEIAASRA